MDSPPTCLFPCTRRGPTCGTTSTESVRHVDSCLLFLQDVEVLPLIKDEGAIWTFGANTMNIDHDVRDFQIRDQVSLWCG